MDFTKEKEKIPQNTRENKDKNIKINQKDYIPDSGGAFAPSDIIDILQRYKSSLQVLLGKRVHLSLSGNKIEWEEYQKNLYKEKESNIEKAMIAELQLIKKRIDFESIQNEKIRIQYNAGVLCAVVEEWMTWLNETEAYVVFSMYINHDWEKGFKQLYKGLSIREIAKNKSINKSSVMKIRNRSIEKIINQVV